nr:sodium channel protein Nach [Neodiprion pinetum]
MINNSLDAFLNRSVAFTIESTYLNWQTKLPSLSVCMRTVPKSLITANSLHSKKFGSKINPYAWRWLFSGITKKSSKQVTNEFTKLTSDDIVSLFTESVVNCTELLTECYWKSIKFDCCEEFHPLQTVGGTCYAINSAQTKSGDTLKNKFTMNRKTGLGYLHVGLTTIALSEQSVNIQVFVHDNLEIPTALTHGDREIYTKFGKVVSIYYNLQETINDDGLRSIPMERRRCRLSDETDNVLYYKRYSSDGCVIELQMENMLTRCGCVSHLFPHTPRMPVCNYTGLQCIHNQNAFAINEEVSKHRCIPDCESAVIKIFQNPQAIAEFSRFKISQGIHLELLELPSYRFRRYVVRSLLDLAVAVGSTVSLFMGAGILSIVEIPYWLLLRHAQ